MARLSVAATVVALTVAVSGCFGGGSSSGVPTGFPAAVVPADGKLLGCSRRSECWFLVSGDSHGTYRRLAGSARSAGWGRFRHSQGLGVDVLVAWKGGREIKIVVTPGGSRVDRWLSRDVPNAPPVVPEGSGLVDIAWGPAEDGL